MRGSSRSPGDSCRRSWGWGWSPRGVRDPRPGSGTAGARRKAGCRSSAAAPLRLPSPSPSPPPPTPMPRMAETIPGGVILSRVAPSPSPSPGIALQSRIKSLNRSLPEPNQVPTQLICYRRRLWDLIWSTLQANKSAILARMGMCPLPMLAWIELGI